MSLHDESFHAFFAMCYVMTVLLEERKLLHVPMSNCDELYHVNLLCFTVMENSFYSNEVNLPMLPLHEDLYEAFFVV